MRDTRYEIGSALILAVVLTSMLAIIGVTFLMVARVNRTATSAISENRELNFAVETVIAKISQELILDVPGEPNEEYYDYPDSANRWLASLEPYYVGPGDYRWWHISDIYDRFGPQGLGVPVGIINDYQSSTDVGDSNASALYPADADGDGVADSRWIKLPNMNSSKGKPIFAAIRIVDNCAMININTAYKFDPTEPIGRIDGSSQMQINLVALAGRPGYTDAEAKQLLEERTNYPESGLDPNDLDEYERDVVWRYDQPDGPYTPFDISDDLELRNRFLVNHEDIKTRIEKLWTWSFNSPTELNTPVDSGGIELDRWFYRTQHDVPGPNDIYSYRHIGTNYNMDRITNPTGEKMANVNTDGEALLYAAIRAGLYDANVPDPNSLAAQMAVNLIDFRDGDANVSTINVGGQTYYGFERPCIYISELAHNFVMPDPNDPNTVYRSYAIELYKPYSEDIDPCAWQLVIDGNSIPITWSGTRQFHVVLFEDSNALLTVSPTASIQTMPLPAGAVVFDGGGLIELRRFVADVNNYIVVDSNAVPFASGDWLGINVGARSIERDIIRHKCIRRLWADAVGAASPTLGYTNSYTDITRPQMIQAHPANAGFTNIGEIGMIFRRPAYNVPSGVTEPEIRLDLTDLRFQQIFNYLTVFDPTVDGIDNNGDGYGIVGVDPNELKIPGRININTAPWYVIAQLPWISAHTPNYELAREIVDYRDQPTVVGFRSIGELNRVVNVLDPNYSIDYYARDGLDQPGFPDLTPGGSLGDDAPDDFEERDVIFSRISNLVTVRSDVFTAYILVRIGTDGPQKRVMAILDRSNVNSTDKKVKVRALHPVPDPR